MPPSDIDDSNESFPHLVGQAGYANCHEHFVCEIAFHAIRIHSEDILVSVEFVSNTLVETSARHDAPPEISPGDYAENQSEAADRQQGQAKIETIRNREIKIGRNEPCPCGSGKKFKACCMRKRDR